MKNALMLFLFITFGSTGAMCQDEMYEICPLKVGAEIPEAQVFDLEGNTKELTDVIGNRSVVLIFFRGGWCPYCTRHLSAVQEVKSEIAALGFDIVALTPDNFSKLDVTIKKSELDYALYSDKDVSAIEAFGLGWKVKDELYTKYKEKYKMDTEEWSGEAHHILPVPALYIVKDGKVKFQYVNPDYSVRMEASTLLALLQSLKG